jgi:hypothetical protein
VLTERWHEYEWDVDRIVAVEGRTDVLARLGLDTLQAG